MATCPNCNVEVEAGAKFCGECGAPIPQEKECPQCHAKWPVKAKFCGDCGFNFATGSMSAAGAALMGSGNTVAGDLVHNVNVVNSGNVNNVVTNNVMTSIVNNTISGGSASALMSSSVGNGSGKRKLTLIFEGMSLVGGYSRFDSFKDMLALPGIERKRLADPANCAVRFSGYILDDCKMSVIVEDGSESPVEHAIKIDSTDFYEDEPPRELMITEDIEKEFDYGSDGAAGYLLSFDRKSRIKFVGTIELPADYNPTALKIEGRKNIWGDYHVATRITYNGCEIALQPQAAQSAKPRKLIAWLKDEYWDLKADSDVDAWLVDVTVEGANVQFSRKVFESEEDLSSIDVAAYENDFHELDDEYFDEHDSCFVAGKSRVTVTNRFTGESAAANIVDGFNGLSFGEASRCFDAPDFSAGAIELYMFAERQGARKYSQICYGEFGLSHVGFKCSKIDAAFDEPVYGLSEPMITGEVMDFDDSHFGELGEVSAWTVSTRGAEKFSRVGNASNSMREEASVSVKTGTYTVRYSGKAIRAEVKSFESMTALNSANLPAVVSEGYGECECLDCAWRLLLEGGHLEVVGPSGEVVWTGDPASVIDVDNDAELLTYAAASGTAVNLFMVRFFDDGMVAELPVNGTFSISDLKLRVGEGSYREFTHNMILEDRKISFVTGLYYKGERLDFDFLSDAVDSDDGPDKNATEHSSWAEAAPSSTGYVKKHYVDAWVEHDLKSMVEKAKILLNAPDRSYDISKGARLMCIAADRGDAEAQMIYADLIVANKGIRAPAIIAVGYYKNAIAGGISIANYKLACLYDKGAENGLAKYVKNCTDLAKEYFLAAKTAGVSIDPS